MTHIAAEYVIGNHADDTGRSAGASSSTPLSVTQALGEVVDRRVGGREMMAAQSTWASEGGAAAREAEDVKGEPAEPLAGLLDMAHPAGPSSTL